MMIKMFEPQLEKKIENYIDDMMVKSKLEVEHVNDLENMFEILRRHKLRLNASKCSFGVGIEVKPDQIKTIKNSQPPRNPKEV